MSEMDVAKMMFGWANESSTMLGLSSSGATSLIAASNVRYGTVIAANEDGTYQVQLDTGEVITMESDTPLSVGDRVSIVNQGGSYVLYSLATFVTRVKDRHLEIAKAIEEKGNEILAAAQADLDEVNAAFDEFKEAHALTDADIQKTIEETAAQTITKFEAAIEDLDETYVTEAEFKAGIDGISSTFSEQYVSANDLGEMEKSLQSQINQNATAIQTEVSDRTQAISGALSEAKSYTDQQAESITTTVTQSVTSALGETYATKTEVQQASDSLHVTVSAEIKDATDALEDDIDTAQSTANSAYNKAADTEDFIETHFEATTAGLTVSSSASSYKARVSPASFDILDTSDTVVSTFTADQIQLGNNSTASQVIMCSGAATIRAYNATTRYSGIVMEGGASNVPYLHLTNQGAFLGSSNAYGYSDNNISCWNTGLGVTIHGDEQIELQSNDGDIDLITYGGDIVFRIGNSTSAYAQWSPYMKTGTSLSVSNFRTAGFLTGSSQTVYFTVPIAKPIINPSGGSVSISITSATLRLRQAGSYTHGSSASATVRASSVSAEYVPGVGIKVTASRTTTTNAINNDVIGIEFTGTFYF